MINTFKETVISIDDAAKHVSKISGKKRNRHLIMRWANQGVAGIRLRTIAIGREIFTSQEALNEFLNETRKVRNQRQSQRTAEGIRRVKVYEQHEAEQLGI